MATILILDDLAANRDFLVTLLRDHGHRLLEAADGREGLAAAQAERPDLVITDVLMPVMDGYEFVRRLRLDPRTSGIPVVFYTSHYGEREARALALSSGVADVLTKPAQSAEVLKIVDRLLAGESASGIAFKVPQLSTEFHREHLRLLTDQLSEKAQDLRIANARLRALINIGLELAAERDSDRLLQRLCVAARDLFGATYVTVGILDLDNRTVQRVVTSGADTADWTKTGDAVPGILGTVVAERRTVRGDNRGGDPARLQLPLRHPDVQAFLAAPIASPAHVHGWMCLVGNEGKSFTEDDEHLVMALAGQVGRIYELEHEILERRQAESAVRQSETRKAAILDSVLDCIVTMDAHGIVIEFNAAAERTFGYTKAEAIGCTLADLIIPPPLRGAHAVGLTHYLSTGEGPLIGKLMEITALRSDGSEIPVELAITAIRSDEGPIFTGVLRDITIRKKAEADLKRAEERTRFALEAAGVGIWDMDYITGVLRWSETLEAHYGLRPGTFGGTFEAFVEHIHPDDRASVLETIGKAMKAGPDFSVQHRTMWPDGTVRWLSGAGRVLFGEHGEPLRAVGISLDITESKRAEAELQRLNDEIQLQRLRVFKATMRTVQDIVGNALMSLYMFRAEVESLASSEAVLRFDQTIRDTAAKLKALGDLDRVVETQMEMGAGIDIPDSGTG